MAFEKYPAAPAGVNRVVVQSRVHLGNGIRQIRVRRQFHVHRAPLIGPHGGRKFLSVSAKIDSTGDRPVDRLPARTGHGSVGIQLCIFLL